MVHGFLALPHASPAIRKLARELGVPLDEVAGSGPKGRITQEDVQGFVKETMVFQGDIIGVPIKWNEV